MRGSAAARRNPCRRRVRLVVGRVGRPVGIQTACAVNLDTIQIVQKSKLRGFVATLTVEKMLKVKEAVHFAPGMDECGLF
jgi:mRNA-degrading endonuclease toxin of MazEF toxin-antitoxin module